MGTGGFFKTVFELPNEFLERNSLNMSTCEGCLTKFGFLRRKRACSECRLNYCSTCLVKERNTARPIRCRRCKVIFSVPINRQEVMELKVRDLCWYLKSKHVSTHGIKEKNELVDLVIQHAPFPQSSSHYRRQSPTQPEPTLDSPNSSDGLGSNSGVSGSTTPENQNNTSQPEVPEESPRDEAHAFPSSASNLSHFSASCPTLNEEPTPEELQPKPMFSPVSVEDLQCRDQISELSVRQMKLILTRNFVDYRGCCEKPELQEKVRWLWAQKDKEKKLLASDKVEDETLCKICMESAIDCVILECGHMCTCTNCGKQLSECPICRQYVVRVVHVFKA